MIWIRRLFSGVVLLIAAIFAGGYFFIRQSLPAIDGSTQIPGLADSVEVTRDRHGIPHIFAPKRDELFFALGYAHAQDRLWQMEVNRRIASGRLAEVFGISAINTDKFIRTLGIRQVAEATFGNLNLETQTALSAYANGVNTYLKLRSGPLPPEFLLVGVTPEPWTPADSIGWLKMMAWDLSANWSKEILRARLAQKLSPEQIADIMPPYPGDERVILPDLRKLYAELQPTFTALAERSPAPLPEGAGSNNWVISGQHSASGKPLLANDPHLGLATPALWYFAHMEAPDYKVIGATLPGIPMVVLGRTDQIAWGFTNTGPDTQDLFIEKIDPADASKYLTPDGSLPFESRTERIKIKGGEDVVLTVRTTRHGPVISDVHKEAGAIAGNGYALAFAWTALRNDDLTMQAGLRFPESKDWASFLEAVKNFHSPQQNMVYADVAGNIGFIAPGRVPVRRVDNELKGMAPAPGWIAKYDWQGFIPFEELPRAYNPVGGQIVTANHKIVPESYPHYITNDWADPYRARRIEQLLSARQTHSLQSFADLQADTHSLMIDEVLPLLLAAPVSSQAGLEAVERLKAWDGDMSGSRAEPLIVAAWLRELGRQIYADELGEELFKAAWAYRPAFIVNVLRDIRGEGRWCDDVTTSTIETCPEKIARALEIAIADLKARYGDDMRTWRWADAHVAISEHRPFSRVSGLDRIFELRVPTPGDTYTVNVGRHDIADEARPYANRHAASLRAIYDLADPDRSLFMHSTGQSGNRLSPLYANFVDLWAKVEYVPMSMRRSDFEMGALGTLWLMPGIQR